MYLISFEKYEYFGFDIKATMAATWYTPFSYMVAAQTIDFTGFVTKTTKTTNFFNNIYYILLCIIIYIIILYIPFFFLLYLFDSLVVLVVLVVYRVE